MPGSKTVNTTYRYCIFEKPDSPARSELWRCPPSSVFDASQMSASFECQLRHSAVIVRVSTADVRCVDAASMRQAKSPVKRLASLFPYWPGAEDCLR